MYRIQYCSADGASKLRDIRYREEQHSRGRPRDDRTSLSWLTAIHAILQLPTTPLCPGDTITIPDDEMIQLMATASVGDDVYKQDAATNALQERIAKLSGKEAALFCVSGTMTNRECVCVCVWELGGCRRSSESLGSSTPLGLSD